MRNCLLSCVVVMMVMVLEAQAQFPQGGRPPRTRFQAMVGDVMGDVTDMAFRFRNGLSRTFGSDSGRTTNFGPSPTFRNQPPREDIDPAILTNEIAPSRQLDEDAPNAPSFIPQGGNRRPPPRGGNGGFSFRRMVDSVMGGMRNMFQGLGRRRVGPNRRVIQQNQFNTPPVQQEFIQEQPQHI